MHEQFIKHDLESSLGHLIEEMGEVQSALGKILRFGYDSYNPLLPENERETNSKWLRREMIDLKLAIERMEQAMDNEGM